MITDKQVKILRKRLSLGAPLYLAASQSGMSIKTARKYGRSDVLPSQTVKPHTWRTREDPFGWVWEEVREMLRVNPGLQAKTIFEELKRRHPDKFEDGQLRTLQRLVKRWRSIEGPAKEVFFPQRHDPARLCQSDFTHMTALGITIRGEPLAHLVYHFVLTYSNWETGCICFSESFESLSDGLQKALWELGGVPERHRSDRLSAAVHNMGSTSGEFTARYQALLSHYRMEGERIQAGKANENGDIEQRHHRFKKAVEQALMLRGSRDFETLDDYAAFLRQLFTELNAGRREKFREEQLRLRPLPGTRLDTTKVLEVRVTRWSTVTLEKRLYSVHSRLIGETVTAHVKLDTIELYLGPTLVDQFPRLRGEQTERINYRHIIDWLVRKPGAFERYLYRDALFPTSYFRMAYDQLVYASPGRAVKEYLRILQLAAKESEAQVNGLLRELLMQERTISADSLEEQLSHGAQLPVIADVQIAPVRLDVYDELITSGE